ncbi:hypothetical protein BC938DRAFT_474626 [Jimgerdemannia flammicorona]|uniref:Uncharacterized protein n=1 Tax=Jimgerdemannia flammicorona TaxID=994334 RepID=A0A433Q1Y7_9FUNG|nr:hypothetical protein BC938DRAFT_474626 [Jimgerdemannia flammicorona]
MPPKIRLDEYPIDGTPDEYIEFYTQCWDGETCGALSEAAVIAPAIVSEEKLVVVSSPTSDVWVRRTVP